MIEQVWWGPGMQPGSKTGKPGREEASRKDFHALVPQRGSIPMLKDPGAGAPSPASMAANCARAQFDLRKVLLVQW